MSGWQISGSSLVVRAGEVFYADDFLLFPDAPKHYQHCCLVQQTYHPYFRLDLQALRTESTLQCLTLD